MTNEEATIIVEAMTAIPFFPGEQAARGMISDELVAMCGTAQQGMWLARRLSQLYSKWPGMREVRAAYCSKYYPGDGIEVYSALYEDGIPSEKSPDLIRLPAPRATITPADPEAARLLTELADECSMLAAAENAPRTAWRRSGA